MLFALKTLARNRNSFVHEAYVYKNLKYELRKNDDQRKQIKFRSGLFHNNYERLFHKNSFNFVSIGVPFKNYKVTVDVIQFLSAHQLQYLQSANGYKIKQCPFCTKPHNNDRSNLFTLNIHKQSGLFHCFRCSSKGNWLRFRQRILGFTQQVFQQMESSYGRSDSKEPKMSQALYYIYKSDLYKQQYKEVLDYIHSRGFNDQTIMKYNLGAGHQQFYNTEGDKLKVKCIYFPNYKILKQDEQKTKLVDQFKNSNPNPNLYSNNSWTQIAKVKIRGSGKQNKKFMRQTPTGGQKGFFGLNVVKDTDNTIVLTQGQFDAMAVYQQTGIPALSLPQGATNLPQTLLPYLKRFQKIILWMDNDEAGILNTSKIAQKIGVNRTHIVNNISKFKDANEFLQKDPTKIIQLISKAKTIPDSSLLSFNSLRDSILARLSKTEQNNGINLSWFPSFNKIVKGIRMGELSIMSGPTGSGKTTLLSQITLDLCKKDISVLWGSFQIRNQILISSMLYQFSDLKIDKHLSKFQYYADKFSQLPLHFMNFYGSHSIQKILSTIIYSIQKHNVHVIVIDTLQFLLSEQADGFKKFQLQDTLMAKLRDISIRYNVHVIIVIHPRKTEDNEDIGIHSIYGTSKATQQADNIWLIQNRQSFKIFQVKKNRYDGQLTRIPIGFNRNTKNFFQLSKEQFQDLRGRQKTMAEIVARRQADKLMQKQEEDQKYNSIFEEQIVDSDLNRVKKNTNFKMPNRQ